MKKIKYIIPLILLFFIRNPFKIDNLHILARPSLLHLLGTDNLGRDIFTRLLIGTVNTIMIVLIAVVLSSIIGNLLGFLSGYFGGVVDNVVEMAIDILLSIPSILVVITIVVLLGAGFKSLIFAILVIYLPSITNYARGLIIKEKDKEYILAAKTYGVKSFRIIVRHIFPNIKKYILLNFEINFSKAILTEASLGFLGIGIDPTIPTLGNMLNSSQSYFLVAPWFTIFPGLMIVYIVYKVSNITLRKKNGRIKN